MLRDHVLPQIVAKRKKTSAIFMQDGAPPHIKSEVVDLLRNTFGESRVISRGFKNFWPANSPDLNPLDFYLWGRLRDDVYSHGRPSNKEELKERIENAIESITNEELLSAVCGVLDRCLLLRENGGGHFEHLL